MIWIALLKSVLSIAGNIFNLIDREQLLKSGEDRAIRASLEKLLTDVKAARKIEDEVDHLSDNDVFTRLRKFQRDGDK